jgi:signal transduction histidine kinase/ActR/RegA family two-component response regulator
MTPTVSMLLIIVAAVSLLLAARRLLYQARTDRAARAETERQLRFSDLMQQLTATLSRARTPGDVIHVCLPDLLYATAGAAGALTLLSDDGATVEVAAAIGFDAEAVDRGRIRASGSRSVIAEAIRLRDLAVVESHDRRSPESRVRAEDDLLAGFPGSIVIPLVTGTRVLGAIAVSLERPRSVEDDEREFLLNAGRHIAQALDRARLYDEAERARGEAEAFRIRADTALKDRLAVEEALRLSEAKYRALATRTSRLYALSAGLSEAVTADALARVMVARGKVVVGAAAGSVYILSDDGAAFEALYAEEYSALEPPPQRIPADPGLCATAAAAARSGVFVGSFAEWQEKYPRSASIAADGGYASTATLPLLTEGRVIGVISFYFTAPVNFDEEYKTLLTSVAQHCAQALERAHLYETAERARADAEAANKSKDDFLSTVSHELRTPLNAILGWAAMLRNGAVDATRRQRALEAIVNNATRQGRLIEELLDVSRIVAGRATLDLQHVKLAENIRGAVEAMMPIAAAKNVDVQVDVAIDEYVVADPRRLEQVVLNLLSNAVKFTPTGGRVDIRVARSGDWVEVTVADTGAGIDPAFLPHVFDRFRQGDTTTTRSVGGLGLGLFIARHLVEAQGGTIQVASEGRDRGATFTVRLKAVNAVSSPPLSADRTSPAEEPEANPALTGIRVLLVDDEADSREMMTSALETCGATVVAAASATEAIRALARAPVDVLLSDIAMPDKDGYELIREIRATRTTRIARVPAAAVTACVREDDRQRALDAGFQMHLAKPVHPSALARAVAALARRPHA